MVDRGDEIFREGQGKAAAETVLQLYDLPQVREKVRQELRGHPGEDLVGEPGGQVLRNLPNEVIGR